jgi:hypothetical protein
MTGAEMIVEERKRQIEVEGWTPNHDEQHSLGELSAAAICYAAKANNQPPVAGILGAYRVPQLWPWATKWWKPSPRDPIRMLVKAGALIAAEIDRLLRKQEATK